MGNPSVSKPSGNSPFEYKPDEQHFFVVSFSEGNPNGRQLKIKLANFNQSSFREKNLKFTTSALPNKTLYLVRTFDNEMDVMRYYSAVKNNPEITAEVARTQANLYIISLSNFRLLFKEKNEPIYLEFFGRKYPG